MGLRFRKSIKLCPGVKLNLSKSGISTSMGIRGAHLTVGKTGVYSNVGIPGTGIYSRDKISGHASSKNRNLGVSDDYEAPLSVEEITEKLNEKAEELNAEMDRQLNIHAVAPPTYYQLRYDKAEYYTTSPDYKESNTGIISAIVFFIISVVPIIKGIDSFVGGIILSVAISIALCSYINRKNKARFEGSEEMQKWKKEKETFDNNELKKEEEFASMIENGPSSDEDRLDRVFYAVDWPRETNITYEVNNNIVSLDVDLPEFEDMPKSIFKVRGRGRGKEICEEEKSERQQRLDYAKHVHGIAFFIARLVFNELAKVEQIMLSGYTQRRSLQTGAIQDDYIYSVIIKRHEWEKIDCTQAEYIDPVSCMENFDMARSMSKTGVFKAIVPFNEIV